MADSPPHEILVIQKGTTDDWEHLRQQCFDIRVQVFHHEQKFPLDTEFDEFVSLPFGTLPTSFLKLKLIRSSHPIFLLSDPSDTKTPQHISCYA